MFGVGTVQHGGAPESKGPEHACTYLGGVDEIHPRFPKKPWEIMEIHEFSLIFNENL